jgi:hypothetical protein
MPASPIQESSTQIFHFKTIPFLNLPYIKDILFPPQFDFTTRIDILSGKAWKLPPNVQLASLIKRCSFVANPDAIISFHCMIDLVISNA